MTLLMKLKNGFFFLRKHINNCIIYFIKMFIFRCKNSNFEKIDSFSKLKIISPNTSFIISLNNNDGFILIEYSSVSGFISGYSSFIIYNKILENSISFWFTCMFLNNLRILNVAKSESILYSFVY